MHQRRSLPHQSDADLLEALQPKPPSLPEPEPTPEVAVVDLEQARPGRTPEPVEQRPATQPKLRETGDPLVEEREAEAGPSRESQLGLKLRTRIADVYTSCPFRNRVHRRMKSLGLPGSKPACNARASKSARSGCGAATSSASCSQRSQDPKMQSLSPHTSASATRTRPATKLDSLFEI